MDPSPTALITEPEIIPEQTKRIERALNSVVWEVESAIDSAIDELRRELVPPHKIQPSSISSLIHEARGMIMDGDNPTEWILEQLRRMQAGVML